MKKNFCFILALVLCFMLCACGKYKKYDTLIDYLEAGDYEQAVQEVEKLRQNSLESKQTITVNITLDNWQDYYEIVLVPSFSANAFREITGANVYHKIQLKESWKDRFVESCVAIAWTVSERALCDFQAKPNERGTLDVSYSNVQPVSYQSSDDGDCCLTGISEDISYGRYGYDDNNIKVDGNTFTWTGYVYQKVDFTRIEGTLTLAEE